MKRSLLLVVTLLLLTGAFAMAADAQDAPKVEVFGGYSLLRVGSVDGSSAFWAKKGFDSSVTFNLTKAVGIETDFRFNEYSASASGGGVSASANIKNIAVMAGPHVAFRNNKLVTPYVHALFGLDMASAGASISGGGSASTGYQRGLGLALGGGIDLNASKAIAIRVCQFDYQMIRIQGTTVNNIALAFGVNFRFGSKK